MSRLNPVKPGRGAATRQRIVERSASVFNKHGYAGTTMSELMAATGLEKGGLYRHFDTKQSLAAAAFDYAWETVRARRRLGMEDCPTSLDKLVLLVRNFVNQPAEVLPGGCPLLNTAIDSDDGDPLLRARTRSALAEWRAGIERLMREGQARGELRRGINPVAVAAVMIAALEGAVMMGRLERSREPMQMVGEHLEDYLRSLQSIAAE